jgi:predicted permease
MEKGERSHPALVLKSFLATPISIAFVLGLGVSLLITYLHVPGAGIFSDVFTDFFVVIRHSLDLLVWIAIGLLVRPVRLRTLVAFLGLVVAVQMIIQPALVSCGAYAAGLPVIYRQLLLNVASMPAGAVAAVLADRYGCDGRLAAVLVVCTYLVSLITIPLLLFVSGGFS